MNVKLVKKFSELSIYMKIHDFFNSPSFDTYVFIDPINVVTYDRIKFNTIFGSMCLAFFFEISFLQPSDRRNFIVCSSLSCYFGKSVGIY